MKTDYMQKKSKHEIDSINLVLKYVFNNPESPYDGYLASNTIPTVEDHNADLTGLTSANTAVYIEVKSSSQPFFSGNTINPYFKLENQPITFENTTTATTATTGNCPYNKHAYSTAVPDEYKDNFFYYINAASTGPNGEKIMQNCKLKKMMDGGWGLAYVLQDGVLFFSPKTFRDALGPYVRRWSKNKNDWQTSLVSWELKRLIDLEKGTFIPFE